MTMIEEPLKALSEETTEVGQPLPFPYNQQTFCRYEPIEKQIDQVRVLVVDSLLRDEDDLSDVARSEWGTAAALEGIMLGTFHSICARILRRESDNLPIQSNFVIFDTDDQERIVKSVIREMNINEKLYRPPSVHGAISRAKNELIGPVEYERTNLDFFGARVAEDGRAADFPRPPVPDRVRSTMRAAPVDAAGRVVGVDLLAGPCLVLLW